MNFRTHYLCIELIQICAKKLFNYLRVAPYPTDGHRSYDIDNEDGDLEFGRLRSNPRSGVISDIENHTGGTVWPKGARVLAFALKAEDELYKSLVTAVHLDSNGEVVDFINLHHILSSRRAPEDIKQLKVSFHSLIFITVIFINTCFQNKAFIILV